MYNQVQQCWCQRHFVSDVHGLPHLQRRSGRRLCCARRSDLDCAVDRCRWGVLQRPWTGHQLECFHLQRQRVLPGTQVYSTLNQPVTQVGTTFTVNLTPAAVLAAGTYWIEIQANMTFGTQGEWGWTDRTVQSNNGAAFRNPGGAFGCGTNWVRKPVCVPTTSGPDQVYRINGTIGGGGTPTPTATGCQARRPPLRRLLVLANTQ